MAFPPISLSPRNLIRPSTGDAQLDSLYAQKRQNDGQAPRNLAALNSPHPLDDVNAFLDKQPGAPGWPEKRQQAPFTELSGMSSDDPSAPMGGPYVPEPDPQQPPQNDELAVLKQELARRQELKALQDELAARQARGAPKPSPPVDMQTMAANLGPAGLSSNPRDLTRSIISGQQRTAPATEVVSAPPRDISRGEAAGRGVSQGLTFNLSDEAAGAAAYDAELRRRGYGQTVGDYGRINRGADLPGGTQRVGTQQEAEAAAQAAAEQAKATYRADDAEAQAQHPATSFSGQLAGTVLNPTSWIGPGGAKTVAGYAANVGKAAAINAGISEAGAVGAEEGDLGQRIQKAGVMPLAEGAAFGAGGKLAFDALGKGSQLVAKGVKDLTARRGPPVAPNPMAANPPAPIGPGTAIVPRPTNGMTAPVGAAPAQAVSSLGNAETWFNALPQKTRESVLRTFSSSGVTNRADQLAIIADLNHLPPGRNSQNAFLIAQKWGERYPSLRENLSNMGGEFSTAAPKGKGDRAQAIMDTEGRKQVNSERAFLESSAEANFGKASPEVQEQMKQELLGLSGTYKKLLDPTRQRKFKGGRADYLDAATDNLRDYLRQPAVVRDMPDWVKQRIMTEASKEMRQLDFTADEIGVITAGDGKVLAPLFSRTQKLEWSPQLWAHLLDQYPRVAGHFLQSAYGRAIGDLKGSMNPADKAMIDSLARARGFSNAEGANKGEGLLHLLEETMPNKDFSPSGEGSYQHTRVNWGDIKDGQEAFDITRRFKAAAQSGEDVAGIVTQMEALSPRAKEAALSEITSFVHDSMGAKVHNSTPDQVGMGAGTAPNLTQLGNENFLQGLRKAFGQRGDALASDIELARSSTTFNTDINRRINSRTTTNAENVKNAPKVYENPAGLEGNVIDRGAQYMAGGAALGGIINPGAAPLLALIPAAKLAWNAYKKNQRLSSKERSLLADFFFRSREAGQDGEALLSAAKPNLPSPLGYAGNVATGAVVGSVAGGVAGGGDPTSIAEGAAVGALAGGLRAKQRAGRARKSIIPERPTNGLNPMAGGKPPPEQNAMVALPNGLKSRLGTGAAAAAFAPIPEGDYNGDGKIDWTDQAMVRAGIGAGAALLVGRGGKRPPRTNELKEPVKDTFGGMVGAKTLAAKGEARPQEALAMAARMEKQGADRDAIWKATAKHLEGTPYIGVHKGADGKWRFEIDDSSFQPTERATVAAGTHWGDEGKFRDFFDGATSEGAYPDIPALKTTIDTNQSGSGQIPKAGPFGKESLTLGTAPTPIGYKDGSYSPIWDEPELRSSALHEKQHSIQDRENFARGGSPVGFQNEQYTAAFQAANDAQVLQAIMERGSLPPSEAAKAFEAATGRKASTEALDIATSGKAHSVPSTPDEAYRRLSGEVEARNVQERRDMTPQERREVPPWATQDRPDNQQIIRFGSNGPQAMFPFGKKGGREGPPRSPDDPFGDKAWAAQKRGSEEKQPSKGASGLPGLGGQGLTRSADGAQPMMGIPEDAAAIYLAHFGSRNEAISRLADSSNYLRSLGKRDAKHMGDVYAEGVEKLRAGEETPIVEGPSFAPRYRLPTERPPPPDTLMNEAGPPVGGKPPPDTMGFGFGGRRGPPTTSISPKVSDAIGRARKSLSPEVRNWLTANAMLPDAERVSAAEAVNDHPNLLAVAAPFQGAKGKANGLDAGLQGSLSRFVKAGSGNAPEVERAADLAAGTKKAAAKAKADATRAANKWLNDNPDAWPAGVSEDDAPIAPIPKSVANAEEQATKLAIQAKEQLARGKLGLISDEQQRAWAQKALAELNDALAPPPPSGMPQKTSNGMLIGGGVRNKPKGPPTASRREAQDMARLLFSPEGAKTLSGLLDGSIEAKPYSPEHLLLHWVLDNPRQAAIYASGAIGAGATIAASSSNGKRQEQAARDERRGRQPVPDPRFYDNPTKNSHDYRRVKEVQAMINKIDPAYNLTEDGFMLNASGKETGTQRAVKFIQDQHGLEPTGLLDDKTIDLISELHRAALSAKTTRPGKTQPAAALQPAGSGR